MERRLEPLEEIVSAARTDTPAVSSLASANNVDIVDWNSSHEDYEIIQQLIDERSNERKKQNYSKADEIKSYLEQYYDIIISDIPYRLGGGSTWIKKFHSLDSSNISLINLSKEVYHLNDPNNIRVIEIIEITKNYLKQIKSRREILLQLKLNDCQNHSTTTSMLGRKYADVAFKFAMGGVDDNELYDLLSNGHLSELKRFGHRKSCGIMDLAQMSEKLACAGIIDQEIYQTTAKLIRSKIAEASESGLNLSCSSLSDLESGEYSVLSDHPLRMLWRFAAKQSKHGKQRRDETDSHLLHDDEKEDFEEDLKLEEDHRDLSQFSTLPDLRSLFDDDTRPLVLDLGCGFGTALLGLCMSFKESNQHIDTEESPTKRGRFQDTRSDGAHAAVTRFFELQRTLRESGCNFLGCDMSKRAIGYATSLANRWKIQNRCKFLHCSVEMLLSSVLSSEYPGPVIWISVNFPTPYSQQLLPYVLDIQAFVQSETKLNPTDRRSLDVVGNSQLPESINDFMATPDLFRTCGLIFEKQKHIPVLGFLYLQSNVEDVALTMKAFVEYLSYQEVTSTLFPELNQLNNMTLSGKFRCLEDSETSFISPLEFQTLWQSDSHFIHEWATVETATSSHSKRQEIWFKLCSESASSSSSHHVSRAIGNGWWKNSPLPLKAKTETEALCSYQQKPIHRIVYIYSTIS